MKIKITQIHWIQNVIRTIQRFKCVFEYWSLFGCLFFSSLLFSYFSSSSSSLIHIDFFLSHPLVLYTGFNTAHWVELVRAALYGKYNGYTMCFECFKSVVFSLFFSRERNRPTHCTGLYRYWNTSQQASASPCCVYNFNMSIT